LYFEDDNTSAFLYDLCEPAELYRISVALLCIEQDGFAIQRLSQPSRLIEMAVLASKVFDLYPPLIFLPTLGIVAMQKQVLRRPDAASAKKTNRQTSRKRCY
jgi:hypothetical protein